MTSMHVCSHQNTLIYKAAGIIARAILKREIRREQQPIFTHNTVDKSQIEQNLQFPLSAYHLL